MDVFAVPKLTNVDGKTWTLLAAGLCTLLPEGNSARTPLVALFVFLFGGKSLSSPNRSKRT